MTRAYYLSRVVIAREALKRGPIMKHKHGYRFGRRSFSGQTITALLDSGEAVRDGNHVVRAPAPTVIMPRD